MKLRQAVIFLVLLFSFNSLSAGGIQVYFAHAAFAKSGKSPFLETYFTVAGNSIKYLKNDLGMYQGKVEVVLVLKQGEAIKFADKYTLLSPGTSDSLSGKDFVDLQRIPLTNGDYTLEFTIRDLNTNEVPVSYSEKVSIDFPEDKVSISDISFSESYTATINPSFQRTGMILFHSQVIFFLKI